MERYNVSLQLVCDTNIVRSCTYFDCDASKVNDIISVMKVGATAKVIRVK